MGRKIPGRKHRGVRDPEKQKLKREKQLKSKINAPPSNIENQDIPHSLTRIMELKEKVKSGELFKRKNKATKPKNKINSDQIVVRAPKPRHGEKPTPTFIQNKGESNERFLHRVSRICQGVITEAHFEDKYGVDVQRNPETGKVEKLVKKAKDPLVKFVKDAKKELKMKGKKKKKKDDEGKLSKAEKRKLKLKARKDNVMERNIDEFESFKDDVGFGEIVHAPPTLTVKPRKVAKTDEVSRPGKRDLLLKSVLNGKESTKSSSVTPGNVKASNSKLKKTVNKVIDKKGKRKDLPNALRRQLDKQQSEIIQAYKELKKQKYVNNK